jgi:GT2 family glycosyltransferase
MSPGRVSIVIPNKNRAELLCQAIASVQAQTHRDWEAIVVDDGSTDESVRRAEQFAQRDPRIRLLRRSGPVEGAPVCRNQAVAAATGEFVVFLDSDDALASHCLARRLDAMRAEPHLDFAVFPCRVFLDRPGDTPFLWNTATDQGDLDRFLALDVPWQTTSPIWTRRALEKIGPWDQDALSWQDWDFHVRALVAGLAYRKFAEADCFWRAPGPSRPSIGRQSFGTEHVASQQRLLKRTSDRLAAAGLLTPDRRRLLAGIYFQIARNWLTAPHRLPGALAIWRRCRQEGLVGESLYARGSLHLCALPVRVPRRLDQAIADNVFGVPLARSFNPLRRRLTKG